MSHPESVNDPELWNILRLSTRGRCCPVMSYIQTASCITNVRGYFCIEEIPAGIEQFCLFSFVCVCVCLCLCVVGLAQATTQPMAVTRAAGTTSTTAQSQWRTRPPCGRPKPTSCSTWQGLTRARAQRPLDRLAPRCRVARDSRRARGQRALWMRAPTRASGEAADQRRVQGLTPHFRSLWSVLLLDLKRP